MVVRAGVGLVGAVAMALVVAGCDGGDATGSGGGGTGSGGAPPDGPQNVTIRFAARHGDTPVKCGETLGALGSEGGVSTLRDLRYFVHDVRLVSDAGVEQPVELDQDGTWQLNGLALLDFEDATGACEHGTPGTRDVVTGKVPPGTYTGVRFKVGVPFEMNHGDPTTAPPPLDTTSLYWGWGDGFMFLQLAMMTTPPSGEDDKAYVFAIASMGCEGDPRYGEAVACSLPNRAEIDLAGFDHATQAVVLDLPAVLEGRELVSKRGCASNVNNEQCVPLFARFGIDYATGAVTAATQTVFRVGAQ
jgi:uncharacterized repeat protein (TIGR04052 family)